MNEAVNEMVGCLEEELRFQKGLLDLGIRKRDELVRLDSAAVERTCREEQAALLALGETVSHRLRISKRLASTLGVPENQATVTGLAARLTGALRDRLMGMAKELRKIIGDLVRVNETNRTLTEQSLAHVRDFFSILTGASAPAAAVYGRTGPSEKTAPGRLMVDRVV